MREANLSLHKTKSMKYKGWRFREVCSEASSVGLLYEGRTSYGELFWDGHVYDRSMTVKEGYGA
jgi:hypothetical protein